MTADLALVLALLAAAIVMFVVNRPRMDVVALIMIAALPLTGVVSVGEAIAGFADPNIVLIAVLFVLDIRLTEAEAEALAKEYGVEQLPLGGRHRHLIDSAQDLGMVEAIVPAESSLIGKTVLEARVRSESGLTVVGLRRGQEVVGDELLEEKLRVGDTLLLIGFWSEIQRLGRESGDLVLLDLPAELDEVLPAHGRAAQALAVAADLGVSPYPFAMTVALAASTAFMTPVSSPVNTLVVGPGNYRFADFIKIGVPFSLLTLVTCVLLVPILLTTDRWACPKREGVHGSHLPPAAHPRSRQGLPIRISCFSRPCRVG